METFNITFSILESRLKTLYPGESLRAFPDRPLECPLLFDGNANDRDVIYVARAEELRGRLLTGLTLICVGEPDETVRKAAADMYIIPEAVELSAVFNAVQNLFQILHFWDVDMTSAAVEHTDVNRLMEVARREFHWSLILLNMHLTPIAASLSPTLFLPGDDTQMFIDLFLEDAALAATGRMETPAGFTNEKMGLTGIYYNICFGDDFQGKLLAVRSIQQRTEAVDLQLFATVCSRMVETYRFFSASNLRSNTYMLVQHALASALRGSELPQSECIETLKLIGWKVNDRYRLFYFPFSKQDAFSNQASFLITLLENRYSSKLSPANGTSSSRGVALDDGVAWILNRSTADHMDIRQVTREMGEMAASFGAKVGLSGECRDFLSLSLYLRQAKSAIITGSSVDPDASIYNFRELSLNHILNNSFAPYGPWDVVHPALLILMKYDTENGTEYNKTLRTFIACRYNVLKASSQLYIHRSTFTVRIKRIEELSDIDLEDERTRLHILFSYYILESVGYSF